MEIIEPIPVLCMCRLCLNYSKDCIEITNQLYASIRNDIRKYLNLEIRDDDTLPKSICQQCIDRIQIFDKYYNQVEQHQRMLQLSTVNNLTNETHIIPSSSKLIHLSPEIVSKANGTLIIQLQTTAENVINTTAFKTTNRIAISKLTEDQTNELAGSTAHASYEQINEQINEQEKEYEFVIGKNQNGSIEKSTAKIQDETSQPMQINIERELDALAVDDITSEIRSESDNEAQCNDDDDEITQDNDNAPTIDDLEHDGERFKGFPTKLIEDSKLLYKGRDLLDMISTFYKLECDVCNKSNPVRFDSLSALCQHYVETHQIKGYVVCCNLKLIKLRAMTLHMARHLQPDAFKCPKCDKMLTCPKILQYHIQNHLPESERPLACLQCPRRFSYSSALLAHAISHQPESQRAAHVCDECGKVFVSAGRLTTHMMSHMQHSQDFTCEICAKSFACRSNLAYHQTTHQPKVRQVQCSKCGKWLKNKLCLRKHMVQHSSIRYSCSMCDYSALNKQCLRNHMQVQHTTDKHHKCDVCGKTFKLKNTLKNHLVQHTGVKRFVCPFCNRSFASSGNFYSHRKRMHPQQLAALLLKQEEEERQLREQSIQLK